MSSGHVVAGLTTPPRKVSSLGHTFIGEDLTGILLETNLPAAHSVGLKHLKERQKGQPRKDFCVPSPSDAPTQVTAGCLLLLLTFGWEPSNCEQARSRAGSPPQGRGFRKGTETSQTGGSQSKVGRALPHLRVLLGTLLTLDELTLIFSLQGKR